MRLTDAEEKALKDIGLQSPLDPLESSLRLAVEGILEARLSRVQALADAWAGGWSGHDVAAPFARALNNALKGDR